MTTSNPHIQWKQSVVEIATLMLCGQGETNFLCSEPTLHIIFPIPYIFSARHIQNILCVLNTDNPALCVQSEIEKCSLFKFWCAHRVLEFQTIAPLVKAYGTGQVKRSDLANSPKTDENWIHVRRHWVCWHKLYPECGSDRHPALVSLLLSY